MNTLRRLTATLLTVTVIAACGSDGRAATVPAPTTTAPPATTAATTPVATPDTTAPDTIAKAATISTAPDTAPATTVAPVAGDPADAILRLEDLPQGFIVATDDGSGDDSDDLSCSDQIFLDAGIGSPDDTNGNSLAEAQFQQSLFGPFVIAAISRVDETQAESFMELLPGTLASCDGEKDVDGNVQHYAPVDFANFKDGTFAVRISTESDSFPFDMVLAMTRSGDLIIVAAHAVVGGAADPSLVEGFMRTMTDRL